MPIPARQRPPTRNANLSRRRSPAARRAAGELAAVVRATAAIWRRAHLDYDQARDVGRAVRRQLGLVRPVRRARVAHLGHEHTTTLITAAYRATAYRRPYPRGLLIKTLLETGARVAEFVRIEASDVYFDECAIAIRHGKGGKERMVPILPTTADELRTHLGDRRVGYLFETRSARCYSTRRVQAIVREVADEAGLTDHRVSPHVLRRELAQHLLERGMPIDQVQLVLGHAKIETTLIYAQATTAMVRDSYQRAMLGSFTRGRGRAAAVARLRSGVTSWAPDVDQGRRKDGGAGPLPTSPRRPA